MGRCGVSVVALWALTFFISLTGVGADIKCTIQNLERSFCVVDDFCMTADEVIVPPGEVECEYQRGIIHPGERSCEQVFELVAGLYERNISRSEERPEVLVNPTLGRSVVMPTYLWMHNIYHYCRAMNLVSNILWSMDPEAEQPKNFVFLDAEETYLKGPWQKGLTKAMAAYSQMKVTDISGKLEKGMQCFESAILTGEDLGLLFQNHTRPVLTWREVNTGTHIPSVPYDSLKFRDQVGHFLEIGSMRFTLGLDTEKCSIPAPPKHLTISKRTGYAEGTRSLGEAERLDQMVEELGQKYGFTVGVSTFEDKLFSQQVEEIYEAGVVIGLHGANLVNSIFMPPMASIIEIMPRFYDWFAYVGGSNSGLQYTFVQSDDPEVEWCDMADIDCQEYLRMRVIKLSEEKWAEVRRKLELALMYVSVLNDMGMVNLVRSGSEFHLERSARNIVLNAWRDAKLVKDEDVDAMFSLGRP